MTDVEGRTAFITGGASGIGLGIARSLAKAGAKVVIADIDAGALATALAELQGLTEAHAVALDVRDRDAYARLADEVEAKLGPVSLLINNAGVAGGAPVTKLTYELWDWGMGINLTGVINGVQTFLPRMAERGAGGHILNTASGAGLAIAGSGVLYTTAKFAVVGMSEALRVELAVHNIGVTVLCPGPVATKIIQNTRMAQPGRPKQLSEGEFKAASDRSSMMERFLEAGVQPDAVGDMALKAIRNNELYIHTDRTMADLIAKRGRDLLDAMPAA